MIIIFPIWALYHGIMNLVESNWLDIFVICRKNQNLEKKKLPTLWVKSSNSLSIKFMTFYERKELLAVTEKTEVCLSTNDTRLISDVLHKRQKLLILQRTISAILADVLCKLSRFFKLQHCQIHLTSRNRRIHQGNNINFPLTVWYPYSEMIIF